MAVEVNAAGVGRRARPAGRRPAARPRRRGRWTCRTRRSTVPPRPVTMSPTTAAGADAQGGRRSTPNRAIASRKPASVSDTASSDRPGDARARADQHQRAAPDPVGEPTRGVEHDHLRDRADEQAQARPGRVVVQHLDDEQRDQRAADAEDRPAGAGVRGERRLVGLVPQGLAQGGLRGRRPRRGRVGDVRARQVDHRDRARPGRACPRRRRTGPAARCRRRPRRAAVR